MSPRDRDHRRRGKSSLIIETLGTGNQAIEPKLASFRKNAASQSGPPRIGFVSPPGADHHSVKLASFRKKAANQSGIFPDWLRFAIWRLTITQPDWLLPKITGPVTRQERVKYLQSGDLSAFICVHRRQFSFPGVTAPWRSRLSFRKNAVSQSGPPRIGFVSPPGA
jgi:hypothetical protein